MAIPVNDAERIRETVLAKYGQVARTVLAGGGTIVDPLAAVQDGCCGASGCGTSSLAGGDYHATDVAGLPADAVHASLGCGNPTALAQLEPGQTVLDLGSGGGIDVLLSARRVGPAGFVYGLDMTDDMLALAEQNRAASGLTNVEFRKGQIEAIPLPDASVDVVISNCVINLSTDKGAVLQEAFRVLRPGGRFAVSDIVVQGEIEMELRASLESWAGCVAGALEEQEYRMLLLRAGFVDPTIEVTQAHDPTIALGCCTPTAGGEKAESGRVVSAFVRARKPNGSEATIE